MKNLLTILALNITIIGTAVGFDKLKDIKATVGNTEILKNWNVGQMKSVNGINITRVSGENTPYSRTNILSGAFSGK